MFECPNCEYAMHREMINEGPDTYMYVYTCEHCGHEYDWIPKREDIDYDD